MDAYSVYLSTFRYAIHADPSDKSTWCQLHKYVHCLRQMLSCCVCGSIMIQPHGPTHKVCLHHVCASCVGRQMRLKPSCSWCRDHEHFVENKKLRVLIQCFKKMCAYIYHSQLGAEISKSPTADSSGTDQEELLKLLKEVHEFKDDEFTLTPPPKDMVIPLSKSMCGGIKNSSVLQIHAKAGNVPLNRIHRITPPSKRFKRGRGRPATSRNNELSIKKSKSNSLQAHANRLRKKALNSKMKNSSESGMNQKKKKSFKKVWSDEKITPFAAQRPHRDKSGKYSVGQLWRETFLEEVSHETYPDSGVDVGCSSDQDPNNVLSSESAPSTSGSDTEIPRKETRQSKLHEKELRSELSIKNVSSSSHEPGKPRLTLTISKKRIRKYNDLSMHLSSDYKSGEYKVKEANNDSIKSRSKKTCRCARFKTPNQLTCFGQKCPCYSDKRGCMKCLCHGCKNPIQASCNSAPSLTHVLRDNENLESSFDSRGMPKLSPII